MAAWLPEGAAAMVLGDRFYGAAEAIAACAARGWDYRLRLKGSLRVFVPGHAASARVGDLAAQQPHLTDVCRQQTSFQRS